MNKTFKIVFNKARGALMVANELTGSVQKKGVRLIVASSIGLFANLAVASTTVADNNSLTINPSDFSTVSSGILISGGNVTVNNFDGSFNVSLTKENKTSSLTINSGKITSPENINYGFGKVVLNDITVSGVSSTTGYGIICVTDPQTGSDSIHWNDSSADAHGFWISNSIFKNNQTKYVGAAITVYDKANINNSIFEGNKTTVVDDGGGALAMGGHAKVIINNSTFNKNTSANIGGAIATRPVNKSVGENAQYGGSYIEIYNSTFSANEAQGTAGKQYTYYEREQGAGGALWLGLKGTQWDGKATVDHKNVVVNSSFTNNKANSLGGAIYNEGNLTISGNSLFHGNSAGTQGGAIYQFGNTLTLNADSNEIISFKDNTAKGLNNDIHLQAVPEGTANFRGDNNATLNITGSGSVLISGGISSTGTNNLVKTNVANLTISSLSDFDGNFNITGGSASIETIGSNAKLLLENGTLATSIAQVYDGAKLDSSSLTKKDNITLQAGTLALTDTGTYTTEFAKALSQSLGPSVNFSIVNASLKEGQTAELIEGIVQNSAIVKLTPSTSGTVSIEGFSKTGAKSLELTEEAPVKIDSNLTLVGDNTGGDFIKNATDITVSSERSLTLGSAETSATVGTLPNLVLEGRSSLSVNNSAVTISSLTGGEGASITLGSADTAGVLHADKLSLNGAKVFLDPAWLGDDQIADASFLSAAEVTDLSGSVVVGRNSVVALGADKATAVQGFNKLTDLSWGENGITAALYLGQAINATRTKMVVNGVLTTRPDTVSDGVLIESNGLLMLDQSGIGNNTALSGATLTLNDGSYIGVVNATAGTVALAESVTNNGANVVTDTPFIVAELSGRNLNLSVSAEGGLGALASTGIQAMTRRADTVLAQTIADRTSLDQELAAGTNLWVDVTGERYEADKLDNGGEFKSDMGYGAFGADFAVTQDITAGTAFQYGKGSLRSGVSSIKNSIDSYGVTAYGAMKFGDAKVVAEASYIKNENDITSSQTALNQSVDSEIYSVGVRGQHRFTAGNFQFVPSVGVRVSRLNTDAMHVGAVNIKKQEQTLVQVPIALRVNDFEQNVSG